MGGYKHRMHQLSSAVGRTQLKAYDERCAEIRRAMNYFWDLLEGVPGLQAHRTPAGSDSNMGGWYAAHGIYKPEELEGLSVTRFAEAVRAEGSVCSPGANRPLHLHPLLNTCDVYGHGRPTRIAQAKRDVRQPMGSLPVTEWLGTRLYSIPWLKRYYPSLIEEHAAAFRKVAENCMDLLDGDASNPPDVGGWRLSSGH
jgi:dTDP-4-amino-4,6-dideoxygalactose transaminase